MNDSRIRLALASENQGKLAELREALAGLELDIATAGELGVHTFPPEEGTT